MDSNSDKERSEKCGMLSTPRARKLGKSARATDCDDDDDDDTDDDTEE